MHNPFKRSRWPLTALIFCVLALAGLEDREVRYAEDAEYCAQVHAKAWPDYEKKYAQLCKDGRVK